MLLKMSNPRNSGYKIASSRGKGNRRHSMCVRAGFPITLMGGLYRARSLYMIQYESDPFMAVENVLAEHVGPWVGRWACMKRPGREGEEISFLPAAILERFCTDLSHLFHFPITGQGFPAKWKRVIPFPRYFIVFREENQGLKNYLTSHSRISPRHLP